MSRKEELERQLEELKARLAEERKKERQKRAYEYRKQHYRQRVFYVPKELQDEDRDYYIFLKLAKQLGIKTFKRDGDFKIYYVEKELERIQRELKAR